MESEDFLKEKAEEAAEQLADGVDIEKNESKNLRIDKNNRFDEKLETDLNNEEGVWSREEVEYLVNNRHKMSNEEMEEFLNRNSEFQEQGFERFSRSEEELIMRNFPMQDVETLAEKIERPEEQVRKKIEMLGLANNLE